MENQEFDHALRDFVKSSQLPYDPEQWDKMALRLEAHDETRKPLPVRRIILFHRWAAGAVAACCIIMAAWYAARDPLPKERSYQHVVVQMPRNANSLSGDAAMQAPEAQASPAAKPTAPPSYPRHNREIAMPGKPGLAVVPEVSAPVPIVVADSTPVRVSAAAVKSGQLVKHDQSPPSFSLPAAIEKDLSTDPKTAFGINGGYNIGNTKNNFTLGVTVKRKLSERLNLETGIAFVSDAYETYRKAEPQAGQVTPMGDEYEATSNKLLYLQAAPSLNYRIYRGLSAGGGVDAQRLLGNRSNAVTLNSLGTQTAAQPQWDFGLTARVDYQVVKKLRAGMMYRESIRAVAKDAPEAARRNYLLLQLSYTIF